MPYTRDNLPAYIKKLSSKQQRAWVAIWNSAFASAKKAGKSDKDAESSAFQAANGVIAKLSASATHSADFGWVTINGNHILIGDSSSIGTGSRGTSGTAIIPTPAGPTPTGSTPAGHAQTAANEVGIDPNAPMPWDLKADAPPRFPGDTSIYSPALKDAAGAYALGRRLQGTATNPKVDYVNPKGEAVNGSPDQVAMHVFIPSTATPAQRSAFEASMIANSDHAQLHLGEMAHSNPDGSLSKTIGDNYWVRGNYQDLNKMAADIGPKLEAQFGKDQHITMMTDATPGGTAIPTGAPVDHFRVVVPFAPGTPKGTVGDISLPVVTTDKIASVMSGPESRGVVTHLDFNGMHIGVSAPPEAVDAMYPAVRALGHINDSNAAAGPMPAPADQHNLGATKFIPAAINLERYPVRDYTRGAGFSSFSTELGSLPVSDSHWASEHATGYSEEGSPAQWLSPPRVITPRVIKSQVIKSQATPQGSPPFWSSLPLWLSPPRNEGSPPARRFVVGLGTQRP